MSHRGSNAAHVSPPPTLLAYAPSFASRPVADSARVQFLRDMLLFFGVKFKITPANTATKPDTSSMTETETKSSGTGEVLVSCVGIGYSNVNKSMA